MTTQGLRSFKARKEIESSELCGCYCCERMYVPETILDWVDNNLTAICRGSQAGTPFDLKGT